MFPKAKLLVILLAATAIAWTSAQNTASPSDGYINALTVSGSYVIGPTDQVVKVAKTETTAVPSNALHDGMDTLILTNGHTRSSRLLFLTNNTVEVYVNDEDNFMSIRVTSLPLETGHTPWYIIASSRHDNGCFYVKYRGDSGYSIFNYDFSAKTFDEPYYVSLPGQGAILSTKDDFDFEVYIEDDGQQLNMITMSQTHESIIPANRIADCAVLHSIQPLDPLEKYKVFLTASCTADDGMIKHYHIDYQYSVSPLNLTATRLDTGVAISGDQYIAVRGAKSLTVYDATSLQNGVPGRYPFTNRIVSVLFQTVANRTWLFVRMENSDLYAVNVSLFVSSRGGKGVFPLVRTNIGLCAPSCLPVTASGDGLIVFAYDDLNSYSSVVFDMSTGIPKEIRRIPNLPERPFAAVFIQSPNFPTYSPLPPTHSPPFLLANSSTVIAIVIPTCIIVLIVLASTVVVGRVAKIRRDKRRNRIRIRQTDEDESTCIEMTNVQVAPGLTTCAIVGNPPATRPQNLKITPPDSEPTETDIDAKTPLLTTPHEEENRPVQVQEKGMAISETSDGAKKPSEYEVNNIKLHK